MRLLNGGIELLPPEAVKQFEKNFAPKDVSSLSDKRDLEKPVIESAPWPHPELVEPEGELGRGAGFATKSLPSGRVGIVGGGTGGLNLATRLAQLGIHVTVIEKRHDPSYSADQDGRSYNLTLGGLGRASSGRTEPLLHAAGQRLVGRRVYTGDRFLERPYGFGVDDYFLSLPRHRLLRIQTQHALDCGVEILFGAEVLNAGLANGRLDWRLSGESALRSDSFDLIVFADGVTGIGRPLICRQPGCSSLKVREGQYVCATVTPTEASRAGLSCDHISFWPAADGPVIGIPNRDRSISVLLVGAIPGPDDRPPFSNETEATRCLESRSPALLEAVPLLGARLAAAARGNFCSSTATHWTLGDRAVVIGDAGRCVPPYVGAGAALAMNDAKELVASLHASASLRDALRKYEENRRIATRIFFRMAAAHAQLLRRNIGSPSWRVISRLKLIAEKELGLRDLYQTIVFDRHGLDRLVARQLARLVPPEVADANKSNVSRFSGERYAPRGGGIHNV
ncbi:MAG TPA: FAD-dependent monooxygenase [Terracidiphilus sp.]|nr:FAD-dependent monooxygenase [Terracidiphilus sp.]